jgi:hypothetical protein
MRNHIFVIVVVAGTLLMGCPSYEPRIGALEDQVDNLQDDSPSSLVEVSEHLASLQTQMNLADAAIAELQGRVDALEIVDVTIQETLDGMYFQTPSYYTVYDDEPTGCEAGSVGYVSTGYFAEGPVVVMTNESGYYWYLESAVFDSCHDVDAGHKAAVIDGEVMVWMYSDGNPIYDSIEVAIIPLTVE